MLRLASGDRSLTSSENAAEGYNLIWVKVLRREDCDLIFEGSIRRQELWNSSSAESREVCGRRYDESFFVEP